MSSRPCHQDGTCSCAARGARPAVRHGNPSHPSWPSASICTMSSRAYTLLLRAASRPRILEMFAGDGDMSGTSASLSVKCTGCHTRMCDERMVLVCSLLSQEKRHEARHDYLANAAGRAAHVRRRVLAVSARQVALRWRRQPPAMPAGFPASTQVPAPRRRRPFVPSCIALHAMGEHLSSAHPVHNCTSGKQFST